MMAGCQEGRSPSMLAAHNCIWIIADIQIKKKKKREKENEKNTVRSTIGYHSNSWASCMAGCKYTV